MKSKEKDPFYGFKPLPTFSRRTYGFVNHFVILSYSGFQKGKWKTGVGIIADSKKNTVTWCYAIKDRRVLKNYFNNFLKHPGLAEEIRMMVVENNKRLQELCAQESGKLSGKELVDTPVV